MSSPPYMRLYWGAYHKHTAHLAKAAHHGAYLLLIGALWNAGGRLPADDASLAGHAHCTPSEWAAMKAMILPFFRISRGKLTQKRVSEELAKYEDTIRKRSEAGKQGGRPSGGKDKGNPKAKAYQKESKSTHNHNQNQKGRIEPSKKGSSPTRREGDDACADGASPPRSTVVDFVEVRDEIAEAERERNREAAKEGLKALATQLGSKRVPA